METAENQPGIPHEENLSRRIDRSLLISLVAVAISLIGTLVSVYEARVLRDQQYLQAEQKSASAWPYVACEQDVSAALRIKTSSLTYTSLRNRSPHHLGSDVW